MSVTLVLNFCSFVRSTHWHLVECRSVAHNSAGILSKYLNIHYYDRWLTKEVHTHTHTHIVKSSQLINTIIEFTYWFGDFFFFPSFFLSTLLSFDRIFCFYERVVYNMNFIFLSACIYRYAKRETHSREVNKKVMWVFVCCNLAWNKRARQRVSQASCIFF